MTVNTHNVRITFGKYGPKDGTPGELYTRLPIQYLKWMVLEKVKEWDLAEAELERRGVVTQDIDISSHAVDRASLRCYNIYQLDRNDDEGLYSWLMRITAEALEHSVPDQKGRYQWKKMKLVISQEYAIPSLVSVMRSGG